MLLRSDASAINEKEEALHAITPLVKAPDMFQCGLLDIPAIGQLEKDAKHALTYHEVSLVGGLLHEDCVEKMRLLILVDLGKTKTSQIPYSMIKDTLNIDDIEVESWVVKAILAMLLNCKIEQMNQVITVRCAFCGGRPLLSLPLLWLYKFSSG
ncbi:hypothetical protein H5410_020843 [Solanum commersonii]|uniref:PCI domain-containing protein n=1 Tax=Solanum commersonii TaxID=4109 RepID=A0A9J5ZA90_SOLCO|nr:hypothetical protein H5410_020843 [Solanum commersonii]